MQKTEQSQNTPVKAKGHVRAVQSGDCLTIQRISKEDPWEEQVYLAYITAPRCGNQNKAEEPFAFDARELVREALIGKKIDFTIEYQVQGRKYVTIPQENSTTSFNLHLVQQGLAKVIDKRSSGPVFEEIKAASDDAQKRKVGLWNADQKHIEKHLRQVTYFGESSYNASKLLEQANKVSTPLAAILEYVYSASYVTLYVYKLQTVIKLQMAHLFSPNSQQEPELVEQGKVFVSKMLLNRTVGIKLTRVDDRGELVGRIHFSAGDIATEVVKAGLAKLQMPKDMNFDAQYFKELKNAQMIAQGKRAGVWKNHVEEQKTTSELSDFTGKVVEVHSGDSLTVERDADFKLIKIFLASIKAPKLTQEVQEPYGWESKESLRKLAIGKKVKVTVEYTRSVPVKSGGSEIQMNFGSIFLLSKNEKNLAAVQLERGLAKTNLHKDTMSKFLEDLLSAEKKAIDSKLCLQSKRDPPKIIINDLVANTKQAKEFEHMISQRGDMKFQGVVEHCFSGMRFKIRLEGENCAVAMSLLGVRTLQADKNQPALLEFATDALNFAKDHLFQRDVTVELFSADKRGTFFGTILMPSKQDFSLKLVEEGLAQTHVIGNEKRMPANFAQIEDMEKIAKKKELGIWSKFLKLVSENNSNQTAETVKKYQFLERVTVEITNVVDGKIFHVRVLDKLAHYAKIESLMASFDPATSQELQKPILKGTLCAVRFQTDGKWYRAKVLGTLAKGQLEVLYIDYGNTDIIHSEDSKNFRKLPPHLLQYEPCAKRCSLAYVKVPRKEKNQGPQAHAYLRKHGLEKVHDAIVVNEQANHMKVILVEEGEPDWSTSLNAFMLSEGLAEIDENAVNDDSTPEDVFAWQEYSDEAREKMIGIWQNEGQGGISDDSDGRDQ